MEGRSEMWRDDVPKYFKKLRKGKWRGGEEPSRVRERYEDNQTLQIRSV